MDLDSRKIVGWEVQFQDNSAHSSAFDQRAVLAEGGIGKTLIPRSATQGDWAD